MTYTAFSGSRIIARGELKEVALKAKERLQQEPTSSVLIFEDETGSQIDVDLRGTPGPGRPKLGVIAREVTLLPQHWEWLSRQPGGASVTLRKLVEEARKQNQAKDLLRQAQEATHKFMTAMAGDRPGYEEALRALYAGDQKAFLTQISAWPQDIRSYTSDLASRAMVGLGVD